MSRITMSTWTPTTFLHPVNFFPAREREHCNSNHHELWLQYKRLHQGNRAGQQDSEGICWCTESVQGDFRRVSHQSVLLNGADYLLE
jgi:hypothetical protein